MQALQLAWDCQKLQSFIEIVGKAQNPYPQNPNTNSQPKIGRLFLVVFYEIAMIVKWSMHVYSVYTSFNVSDPSNPRQFFCYFCVTPRGLQTCTNILSTRNCKLLGNRDVIESSPSSRKRPWASNSSRLWSLIQDQALWSLLGTQQYATVSNLSLHRLQKKYVSGMVLHDYILQYIGMYIGV